MSRETNDIILSHLKGQLIVGAEIDYKDEIFKIKFESGVRAAFWVNDDNVFCFDVDREDRH